MDIGALKRKDEAGLAPKAAHHVRQGVTSLRVRRRDRQAIVLA